MHPHSTTPMHPYVKDISGQRFVRLVVVSFSGIDVSHHARWNCVCDCGSSCIVDGGKLRKGLIRSCGCLAKEVSSVNNATHGFSKHPLWNTYYKMIQRCHNPAHPDYDSYGKRGIVVCERWRTSFANFLADMGNRPDGQSIDRIDNNGPYSPENCRWATITQQNNNTRQNHTLTYNGETLTITEWSVRLGISDRTIRSRLRYGWSVERILAEPVSPPPPIRQAT